MYTHNVKWRNGVKTQAQIMAYLSELWNLDVLR